MTETLANGYSCESTQRELSNEYQLDRVSMVFENICVLVIWMKETSALEGLMTFFHVHAACAMEECVQFTCNMMNRGPQVVIRWTNDKL